MRTEIPDATLATERGSRADAILRTCVHCGMCNATCPTYQVRGDELDGPRGRIYLIKGLIESGEANAVARTHLDRCLTCRACETAERGLRLGEPDTFDSTLLGWGSSSQRCATTECSGMGAVIHRRLRALNPCPYPTIVA